MSSREHLELVERVTVGRWGVYRALGGVVPARGTSGMARDLIIALEPRQARRGVRGRTDEECRRLAEAICDRINRSGSTSR